MKLILASASPRRREILELIGLSPDAIVPSDADETMDGALPPDQTVMELAKRKAESVKRRVGDGDVILASDTIVVCDGAALGKPRDAAHARAMLETLSGRTHAVYTGVCICYQEKTDVFFRKTDVEFYTLSPQEIDDYIETGEPFDKAGAYGIQGKGSVLIRRIDGDFFSVMGLPAADVYRHVKQIIHTSEDDGNVV